MKDLTQLIADTLAGDLDSFGLVVRRFQDMAYAYAYSVLGDFHLAQDVTQEAFVEAYQTLENLREPAAFPGWFRRIVLSRCHRILRRKQPPQDSMDKLVHLPAGDPRPDQASQCRDMNNLVIKAINALPTPQREATALYYMDGHSQAEIADFLEVPVTTVKSRLHAARKQLRKGMVSMIQTSLERSSLPDGFARDTVEKAVVRAKELSRKREYRTAEDILRRALEKIPEHPAAMEALNHAIWQSNISEEEGRWQDLPELVEHGLAMLSTDRGDQRLKTNIAKTLLVIPAIPEAISFIEQWIRDDGAGPAQLGMLAWARGCAGDYNGAESTWDELLATAGEAGTVQITNVVPEACDALVDCLASAGELARAQRTARDGWALCREIRATFPRDWTDFCCWPGLFRQAGAESECERIASEWLAVASAKQSRNAWTHGEALCARAWFDDADVLTDDWLQWLRQSVKADEWRAVKQVGRALRSSLAKARRCRDLTQLCRATFGFLEAFPGVSARELRQTWEWWQYSCSCYFQAGGYADVEKVGREAIEAGYEAEGWWLTDIAVARGEPTPQETMAQLGKGNPDEWGLWYYMAREAAAAGDEKKAFDALRRACDYWAWTNPPLVYMKLWANDTRWGALREHPEFRRILAEKEQRIGPIHGFLKYFPNW